jgi:hypothetical protein
MGTLQRAALAAAIIIVMSAPGGAADEWTPDLTGNLLIPPVPATSQRLFNPIDEAKDPACPRRAEVILHYLLSKSDLKAGNIKLLVGDLPQLFSDSWRRRLRIKAIAVSGVVAQPLDLSRLGGGAALDVTEFDTEGCAFSRTIMPAAIWNELLRAAVGVAV